MRGRREVRTQTWRSPSALIDRESVINLSTGGCLGQHLIVNEWKGAQVASGSHDLPSISALHVSARKPVWPRLANRASATPDA